MDKRKKAQLDSLLTIAASGLENSALSRVLALGNVCLQASSLVPRKSAVSLLQIFVLKSYVHEVNV